MVDRRRLARQRRRPRPEAIRGPTRSSPEQLGLRRSGTTPCSTASRSRSEPVGPASASHDLVVPARLPPPHRAVRVPTRSRRVSRRARLASYDGVPAPRDRTRDPPLPPLRHRPGRPRAPSGTRSSPRPSCCGLRHRPYRCPDASSRRSPNRTRSRSLHPRSSRPVPARPACDPGPGTAASTERASTRSGSSRRSATPPRRDDLPTIHETLVETVGATWAPPVGMWSSPRATPTAMHAAT